METWDILMQIRVTAHRSSLKTVGFEKGFKEQREKTWWRLADSTGIAGSGKEDKHTGLGRGHNGREHPDKCIGLSEDDLEGESKWRALKGSNYKQIGTSQIKALSKTHYSQHQTPI